MFVNPPHPTEPDTRRRKLLLATLMLALAALAAFVIAEVALLATAPRGITYHSYKYDPLTQGTLYPNSKVLYRDDAGRVIRRHVNRDGYLDLDHDKTKNPGTYRIGFFGDSYVEARQVKLEETFFRLAEQQLVRRIDPVKPLFGDDRVLTSIETLAFGIAGRSTIQSFLDCTRQMEAFDLDCVVYVMFENDPRDQLKAARWETKLPYAYMQGDTFALDYSAGEFFEARDTGPRRLLQQLKAHSLVLSTIDRRLRLLRQYGINMETDRRATPRIHANTAPSTWWSDSLLTYAEVLQERVMTGWRDWVVKRGRTFFVIYIPWEPDLRKPTFEQDSWAPWLHDTCALRAIPLIDPTPYFVEALDAGHNPFDDHLTPVGHEAVAKAFVAQFVVHARRKR